MTDVKEISCISVLLFKGFAIMKPFFLLAFMFIISNISQGLAAGADLPAAVAGRPAAIQQQRKIQS